MCNTTRGSMPVQDARRAGAALELANSLPCSNVLGEQVKWGETTQLRNKVQLSAYPDCIGGDLAHLKVRTRECRLSTCVPRLHWRRPRAPSRCARACNASSRARCSLASEPPTPLH
jgi:hypothetical protein